MSKSKISLLLFIILFINCSKKKCNDLYILDRIEIFNYQLQNAQNIVITGFGDDITVAYQITSIETLDSTGFNHYVFLDKNINTDYSYDVFFVDIDFHAMITDIKVLESKCKNGLFSDDYEYALDEFNMNGTHFMCQVLKVSS